MKKSTLIIGFALTVSLLTSMFVFREIPVLSPWKNWKVLSVSIDIPESKVITDLSNIAINNVVTESSPKLQINSNFAPVLPSEYNFYKDNLYRFFYDKEHKFRLYYLPKDVSNKTLKALDFDYNVDLQSSFPYFGLIITVIVYIIQLFLIKNTVHNLHL